MRIIRRSLMIWDSQNPIDTRIKRRFIGVKKHYLHFTAVTRVVPLTILNSNVEFGGLQLLHVGTIHSFLLLVLEDTTCAPSVASLVHLKTQHFPLVFFVIFSQWFIQLLQIVHALSAVRPLCLTYFTIICNTDLGGYIFWYLFCS